MLVEVGLLIKAETRGTEAGTARFGGGGAGDRVLHLPAAESQETAARAKPNRHLREDRDDF